MSEIIKSYIIQHKNVRGEWVNEQVFSNALDCYTVIKKWGVVWPSEEHRCISVQIHPTFAKEVLSIHKASYAKGVISVRDI